MNFEGMSEEEKIESIKSQIPEEVYNVFSQELSARDSRG